MRNLVNMDLYRMWRSKAFWICLLLTFALALGSAPVARLMVSMASHLTPDADETAMASVNLSEIISKPLPVMGLMLLLLSLCFFFYADVANGYIKNIAGQMPRKGYTILSKFLAAIVHNLIFAAAGIIGKTAGSLLVQRIVLGSGIPDSIRILVLKLLLIQSISTILLLVVSTLRSKSLGMILAVLFGLGLTPLIYFGINEGLGLIFKNGVDISKYMPDAVMDEDPLDTVKALLVAFISGGAALFLSIRLFDRKDVR